MTGIAVDFRAAVRALVRSPLHTTIAVSMLAIGIGATTSIFGIVDAVLLRPLPYAEPGRLVWLWEASASADYGTAAPPNALEAVSLSRTLEAVGLVRGWQHSVRRDGVARGENVGIVTPELFAVLGVAPQLGRWPRADEQHGAGAHVVVLSDAYWRTAFGGRRDAIGSTLTLDGEPYEVIGVAPPRFTVPNTYEPALWKPLHIDPRADEHRDWRGFGAIARVRAGTSDVELAADLARISMALAASYPETNTGYRLQAKPLQERVTGAARPMLLLFMGAVALVLLIVCANTANLLLARAARRQFELAVRLANGASRWRLARQQLLESALLCAAGAIGGLLVAVPATRVLLTLSPSALPRSSELGMSVGVYGFAIALAVTATFAVGLLPAFWSSRANVQVLLRQGDARVKGFGRGRAALVVVEVALSVMLLAGAGVLLRSLARQLNWDPGFPRAGLLMTQVFPPQDEYGTDEQLTAFYELAKESLRAVPGVVSVGAGSAGPIFGGLDAYEYRRAGSVEADGSVRALDIDENYFATLGLQVVRGRNFTARDGPGAPAVAIVNEAFVRANWPDGEALGEHIELMEAQRIVEVVGVVRDVNAFPGDGAEMNGPAVYTVQRQAPRGATFLVMRTSVPAETLLERAQQQLLALEPDLSIGRTTTMDLQVQDYTARPRFNLLILSLFSAVALLLALTGLYSVIAFTATQRTREFGIRLALGGTPLGIIRLIVSQSLRLVLLGAFLGTMGAVLTAGVLEKLVYGVDPRDPLTYAGAAALLAVTAVLAAMAPALRAARQDPSWALREV